MPLNIVTRQIDFTTNMLATPYCPASVVGNEFYIPGTDPVYPCSVHTQFGMTCDRRPVIDRVLPLSAAYLLRMLHIFRARGYITRYS